MEILKIGNEPNPSLRWEREHTGMENHPRLTQLLALADKGPALRAALIEELTELLAFWPDDCPAEMRAPCEALLAKTSRAADDKMRAVSPANDMLEHTLIEMARSGLDVHARLAEALKLSRADLEDILASDHGLALICKRLGLSRTAFSTLTMLMGDADAHAALDGYDAVTPEAAEEFRGAHTAHVISFPRELRAARAS
jgi:hypothetical protein